MEFTKVHEDALVHAPWQACSADSTSYLFKFAYNEDELSCSFLLTDTTRVWVEVLSGRHILRRCRRLGSLSDEDDSMDPDEETRKALLSLNSLHSIGEAESLEPSIVASDDADLLLNLVGENITWRWELELLRGFRGAELLSKHLIMPLLGISNVLLDNNDAVPHTASDIRGLEKRVDASGRTAIRHRQKLLSSIFGQTFFSTSLRRWTETASGTQTKSSILLAVEDELSKFASPPTSPVLKPSSSSHRVRGSSTKRSAPPYSMTSSPNVSPPLPSTVKEKADSSETETEPDEDVKPDEPEQNSPPPAEPSPSPSPPPMAPSRRTPKRGAKRSVSLDDEEELDEPKKIPTAAPKSRVKIKRSKY